MSICAGRTYCEIYRDKKYCRSSNCEMNGICNCIHVVHKCEVGHCPFLFKIHPARKGGPDAYEICEFAKQRKLKIFKER